MHCTLALTFYHYCFFLDFRTMRQVPPAELQRCVWDFVEGIAILPKWIESSASDKPGRGHYEWGNWSDAIREVPMWVLGGPWRTIIADARLTQLVSSVTTLHKLKDQFVWEIVEQTYHRAEQKRKSTAGEETVKTRIRSVFSWQRRHDVRVRSACFNFIHPVMVSFFSSLKTKSDPPCIQCSQPFFSPSD